MNTQTQENCSTLYPATGCNPPLPAYAAADPCRAALYRRLVVKGLSDWNAADYADWHTATGWRMPVRLTPAAQS